MRPGRKFMKEEEEEEEVEEEGSGLITQLILPGFFV